MKRLILTLDDSQVGTVIDALRGSFKSMTIEDCSPPAAEQPVPKRRMNPRGSKVEAAILGLRANGPEFDDAAGMAAIAATGFSPNSLSPVMTRLAAAGKVERLGRGRYRFTDTQT